MKPKTAAVLWALLFWTLLLVDFYVVRPELLAAREELKAYRAAICIPQPAHD